MRSETPAAASRPILAAARARVAAAEECQADAMASLDAARRIYEGTRKAVAAARDALWEALGDAITPGGAADRRQACLPPVEPTARSVGEQL
jgi:hypothetical protein